MTFENKVRKRKKRASQRPRHDQQAHVQLLRRRSVFLDDQRARPDGHDLEAQQQTARDTRHHQPGIGSGHVPQRSNRRPPGADEGPGRNDPGAYRKAGEHQQVLLCRPQQRNWRYHHNSPRPPRSQTADRRQDATQAEPKAQRR